MSTPGFQHNAVSGVDLHIFAYVQSGDPGAIGAGMAWVDTSGGTGAWVLKIRNLTNDGWESSRSAGAAAYSGAGSPEGAQVAEVGSTYWRTSDTTLWIKNTGSGNTGWIQFG